MGLYMCCMQREDQIVLPAELPPHPMPELVDCVTGAGVVIDWGGKFGVHACLLLDSATAPAWASRAPTKDGRKAMASATTTGSRPTPLPVLFIEGRAGWDGTTRFVESLGSVDAKDILTLLADGSNNTAPITAARYSVLTSPGLPVVTGPLSCLTLVVRLCGGRARLEQDRFEAESKNGRPAAALVHAARLLAIYRNAQAAQQVR